MPYVTQTDYCDAKAEFHLVGDGVADDSAGLQAALDTKKTIGIAPGPFKTAHQLNLKTPDQRIEGSGRRRTTIIGARGLIGGILKFQCGEQGPQLSHMEVRSEDYGGATGIIAHNTPRFDIEDLRIVRCNTSIDMTGNCGGAQINKLESWATANNIVIDGALDTVTISRLRCWPFDDPGDGQGGPKYITATGIQLGRCDGFFIDHSMFFLQNGIGSHLGADGVGPIGSITACDFDTWNGINIEDGDLTISGNMFTGGSLYGQTVSCNLSQTGGKAVVTGNQFFNWYSSMVGVGGGMMTCTGNHLEGGDNPYAFFAQWGGDAICSGNRFERNRWIPNTAGLITCTGGRLTAHGNRGPIDGTGRFVTVKNDEWHSIQGNRGGGWTHSFPPLPSFGIYRDN